MKALANKEIFVIIFTIGTLLFSNGVLATSGKYARLSEACVTAGFPASNIPSHIFG